MNFSEEALEAICDRAARKGAMQALREIGLGDEHAGKDISELRGLLESWRAAKSEAWRTIIRWGVTALLVIAAAGVVVKTGINPLNGGK